jgi:thiosulfate/3-mercaptopyruvate sulfurtransferase
MRTNSTRSLITLAAVVLLAGATRTFPQTENPWTEEELKDPAALAKVIKDPKAPKPVIFNIGPARQIKGAIRIGPVSKSANLEQLKQQLAKLPKDREVIIYCGCCPFRRCPNIRPAFELLKEMKFTKPRLLHLPNDLNEDWVSKGYPME